MELPWYPHDIQDYDESTADLTLQQHGVYRRMLDHYYRSRAPLPAPLLAINRIVGAHTVSERKDISYILHRFFELKDDGWHQHRADDELTEADDITDKRSKAGSAGAKKRWRNHSKSDGKPNGKRMANGVANECTLNTEQGLETNVSKPKRAALFVLPDWVPKPEWEGFIEVRKRAKSNPTDHAKSLLVSKLEKLKEQGFSPQECIETAIERGWKSFFPPPTQKHANGQDAGTPHDKFLTGGLAALGKFKAT